MKVAIVTAVCVGRDAISAAAAAQADLAAALPEVESVDVFSSYVGRPLGVANHIVHDAWTLLNHPQFRRADVAVFHWGIHHPLFDALTVLSVSRSPAPV